MKIIRKLLPLLGFLCTTATAQVHYTGKTLSDPQRHDGGLSPVIGVHCIQTMRANRENPDSLGHVMPWTYNHQPMLAKWKGRLWMHYLSDPVSEHVPPSQTFLQVSSDGTSWSAPQTLFPDYGRGMMAVMHQRCGWFVSSETTGKRLLALAHYGICRTPKDDPNDGNGIGRVVREIKEDGSLGPIYFLYLNHDMKPADVRWPMYTKSKDKKFRKACQEILNDPLMWMQMVEECDRNDSRLPLKKIYKAFCHYRLPDDSTIVGLWKHSLTSQSKDGGRTWSEPVARARGFVNSNAKIWGQRLSDGTYATVYNPAEFRWPLAISTSIDGEEYTTLNLIHGEMTPLRYGGQYKSHGPQYVRGIEASDQPQKAGEPMFVAYSVNKEDMWVARIPVPIRTRALTHANDEFSKAETLNDWNIMSAVWAPVTTENGRLKLSDCDPFEFAKAERVIPSTRQLEVEMNITPAQNNHGDLQIELVNDHGDACTRLSFQPDGMITIKTGARYNTLLNGYEANHTYNIKMYCDLDARMVTIWIDGKKKGPKILFAPVENISRLTFRTGSRRFDPTIDSPADTPAGEDLPAAGSKVSEASYYINNVVTSSGKDYASRGALLDWNNFKHYAEYFNNMESEQTVQAIANSQSAAWMENNIPLFECPDKQIEQMYYYRWWSLRKSIRKTPMGYAMNEFLVPRSYADDYNLIACALGHHIMESRWLRDTKYLEDNVNIWLRGNNNAAMTKLCNFSSWLPWAMWQRSLQQGNATWMSKYNADLQAHLAFWEKTNMWTDSLFWQRDVRDGMEEQISGARRQNHRRPTINSYMYGNYKAMEWLNQGKSSATDYAQKAARLRSLTLSKLWNPALKFFGTLTEGDTLAAVREEIGYLPWYFSMANDDASKYLPAWMQLADEKGFNAPYGITTAERRHPLFRKRFRPKRPSCEWDGAIWPFATSQTLTALANIMNDSPQLAKSISDSCLNVVYNKGADPRDVRESRIVDGNLFYYHLKKYTESQYHRGRPYIGEYLDETTGSWLMGDRERSKYYNHSTYNDLIITGLIGLRPSMEDSIKVNPLIPSSWDYFCIDNLPYHGKLLTIFYDKHGNRYHQGKGLHIIVREETLY